MRDTDNIVQFEDTQGEEYGQSWYDCHPPQIGDDITLYTVRDKDGNYINKDRKSRYNSIEILRGVVVKRKLCFEENGYDSMTYQQRVFYQIVIEKRKWRMRLWKLKRSIIG